MTSTSARSSRALVGLALAAACLLVGAAPATGGAPPAEPALVSLAIWSAPFATAIGECDGSVTPTAPSAGGFIVERTGPLLSELVVPLTFTGEKAADIEDVPAAVTIPVGEESMYVGVGLTDISPGTLAVTLGDGPDHDLGDPVTADLTVVPDVTLTANCLNPWPVTEGTEDQTIAVGEVPQPYGFASLVGPGDPQPQSAAPVGRDLPPVGSLTALAHGTLPPGLTYLDDEWGGAATTPGTYAFRVAICEVSGGGCAGSAAVTVTVVGPDTGSGHGVGAGPAVPVRGPARFTG